MHSWPFAPLQPRSYEMIVADPPWTFKTYSPKGWGKSAQRHYGCMDMTAIRSLPVGDLAAPDAALVLWATSCMLDQAFAVMAGWGFTFKTSGVWVKTTRKGKIAFGTGYRLRNSHEPFLIGVKGNPKNTRGERSAIMAPVREHSRKPDEVFAMCERWLPNARRLDLFSRERRIGWDSFGNEADKFDEVAA